MTCQRLYRRWGEAVFTAVYLLNRMPTPVLNWNSPFSRLFGHIPCYSDLRFFGCACYLHLGAYVTNKLLPRTAECVFLGYSSQHKGYRCLDPVTRRVYVSRHVRFDETTYPYASRHYAPSSPADSDIALVPVLPPAATCPHSPRPCSRQTSFTLPTASGSSVDSQPISASDLASPQATSGPSSDPSTPPTPADPSPNGPSSGPDSSSPAQLHPMVTCLRDGIHRPLVRTDGTVRYPLPRSLSASLSSSYDPCFS